MEKGNNGGSGSLTVAEVAYRRAKAAKAAAKAKGRGEAVYRGKAGATTKGRGTKGKPGSKSSSSKGMREMSHSNEMKSLFAGDMKKGKKGGSQGNGQNEKRSFGPRKSFKSKARYKRRK
eukprot:TRINITY_DN12548_c0_g1_i1.p1 TRINITY_DN12548_c0_g1~~TRINITY_DN12548_c0_g1_i1.p1  ORF type:complete len:119 (-),score=44.12 TRINITY_DN12548_c0_g1_i1:79-435(-)